MPAHGSSRSSGRKAILRAATTVPRTARAAISFGSTAARNRSFSTSRAPDDNELLARLIARADVLVQNLMPGAMARAGFDLEELRQRHPRLVICSISGYGESGPYRDMKSYDMLIQAETGLASLDRAGRGAGPGRRFGDRHCGRAQRLRRNLEALLARERTGYGALIRVRCSTRPPNGWRCR